MERPSIAIIPSAYKTGVLAAVLPNNGIADLDFTRGSIATRVNAQGLIEEVGVNVPRLDYSSGGCPSLLLEPQSINLITYSEDFSNESWVKLASIISSNSIISPKGELTADTIIDDTANTTHRFYQLISLSASTDYAVSVFAKKGTNNFIQLSLRNSSDSSTASYVFDLENGVLGEIIESGNGNIVGGKIEDYGNGWYRCTIIGNITTAPNQYSVMLADSASGNTFGVNGMVTYLGTGTNTVYLWGAQLEQQSSDTSYIPTQITQITRLEDAPSLDLTPFNITSIIETIDGVEQPPITTIPTIYNVPIGRINKILMY